MIKVMQRRPEVRRPADAGNIYTNGTYLENNLNWHVEDSPWKASQIYEILSKNEIVPETIGEIGCGAGEILRQLSLKLPSTNFYGYEISPQAYNLCKTREAEKIEYRFRDLLSEDICFDVLLCIDVFEHVDDYIGFVKALKSKAKLKVFHIPLDISVLSVLREGMLTARNTVGHLHYFTPSTAIATLTYAGYDIVDSFYTTSFKDLPSKTIKAKAARLPRKILYAISPELMIKFMGGCSLIVLAK